MDILRQGRSSVVCRLLHTAAIILLSAISLSAMAGIDEANQWFSGHLQADGSYGASPLASSYQTTSEVLLAYHATQYLPNPTTLDYLGTPSYLNTENQARRIITAVSAGRDVAAWANGLEAYGNLDGGYGELGGYQSTTLDTAFALQALVAAGRKREASVAYVTGFLLNHQQPDGAWTDGNNDSSLYVTALAVQALTPLKSSFAGVSAALSAGKDFLLSQRHTDGTWGDTFLSAQALLALLPNISDVTALDASIAVLQAAQDSDGSWGQNVYSTALAVRALGAYAARSSVTADPSKAAVVGTVIVAGSRAPLGGAAVSVNELPGTKAVTASDGSFTVSGLASGSYTITISKAGYTSQSEVVSLVVGEIHQLGSLALEMQSDQGYIVGTVLDGENGLPVGSVTVSLSGTETWTITSDAQGHYEFGPLAPASYQIVFAGSSYSTVSGAVSAVAGQQTVLNVSLTAEGSYDVSPGEVWGRVVDGQSGQPLVGAQFSLNNGQNDTTDNNGQFRLKAVERGSYEANLTASGYQGESLAVLYAPNISGDLGTLTLYPSASTATPTTLTIHGSVVDATSGVPVGGIIVSTDSGLSDITDSSGQFVLDGLSSTSVSVSLSGNGYQTAQYTLSASGFGALQVSLAVTPADSATGPVTSTLSARGTVIDASSGLGLGSAIITLNTDGDAPTVVTDADGRFFLSDLPSEQVTLTIEAAGYITKHKTATLAPLAITDLGLIGLYDVNTPLPDLVVNDIDNTGASTDPRTLTYSGTIHVGVANVGTLPAEQAISLVAFYDSNGDGVYQEIADGYLGEASTTSALAVGGSESVTIPVFGGLPYRDAPIRVWVDSKEQVDERSEDNNVLSVASQCVVATAAGDGNQTEAVDLTVSVLALIRDKSGYPALRVRVGNAGAIATSGNETVSFYEGDPLAGGALLGSVAVPVLAPESYQDILLEKVTSLSGENDIYTIVDINDQVTECNEGNNQVSIPAPQVLPDLLVSSVDSSAVATDPFSLKVSGSVGAVIENQGTKEASTDLLLLAFYDMDGDGHYKAGIDILLGRNVINGGLGVGAQEETSLLLNGDAPFMDAPIYLVIDAENAVKESSDENNITVALNRACQARPDKAKFSPVVKWHWSGSDIAPDYDQVMSAPTVAQTNDDNGDGRIDQRDIPDVIFVSYALPTTVNWIPYGILRIVSGKDGSDLVTVNDRDNMFISYANLAVGDIDNDGLIEIVGSRRDGGLIAFENDGTLKWVSKVSVGWWNFGGPSIADLDGDGTAEIVFGGTVWNGDGSLRWKGPYGYNVGGAYWQGSLSTVADINMDGSQEVIVGACAYSADGRRLWINTSVGDGATAVGNFNDDQYAEIVVVRDGRIHLLDHQGNVIWGPVALPGGRGGPPTIADLDGDGEPEIGVAGKTFYTVFETDGTIKWSMPIQEYSSGFTGSSVFDFDDDGTAEVVYADETNLWVFNGIDGSVVFQMENNSGTAYEFPVVADVDNDGHANIVVVSNQYYGGDLTGVHGVRILEDVNHAWTGTRSIWNQHSYHVTNINDDGTIPAHERPSWLEHNTYRLNTFLDSKPSTRTIPDLSIAKLAVIDGVSGQQFGVRVGNGGLGSTADNTRLSFYAGDPQNGGQLLATTVLEPFDANSYRDVTVPATLAYDGTDDLYAVVDADEAVNECNETNNRIILSATTVVSQLGQLSVQTDRAVYPPNSPVILNGSVTNNGALNGNYSTQLRIVDSNGVVVATFPLQSVTELPSGSVTTAVDYWNTGLTLAGSYRVHGTLTNTDGKVLAETETSFEINHSAEAGAVAGLRTSSDRPVYNTTDTVDIANLVQNLTTNTILGAASLNLVISDAGNSVEYQTNLPLSEIVPGGERLLTHSYSFTAVGQGEYRIDASLLASDGSTLASSSTSYQVKEDLTRSLSAEVQVSTPSLYQGETQLCTDTLANHGTLDLTALKVRQLVVDLDAANEDLTSGQTVELAHGGSLSLTRSFATGEFAIGMHACVLQVQIEGNWHTLANQPFAVQEPPIKIDASLTVGERGRLLILLDDSAVSASDPQGPREAAVLMAQRTWLESQLDTAGWSYSVVTNAVDFTRELRSGGYTIYLLQAEHVKLPEAVQKELREAVFRGEGLVVAGDHDERNHHVDEALGVKVAGKLPGVSGVNLSDSPVSSALQLSFNSPRQGLKVQAETAEVVGRYLRGDTALILNSYGEGRAVFFASDLLAEAAQKGDSEAALGTLLLNALAAVHPQSLSPIAGSVYPLHLSLLNEGIPTPGQVQVAQPADVDVIDPGVGQVSDGTVVFPFDLAEAQSLNFDLWVRLPQAAGPLSFNADILTGTAPALKFYDSIALPLQTTAASNVMDAQNELTSVQAQLGKQALKTVQRELGNAGDALASNDVEGAIRALLGAGDALQDEASEGARSLRRAIDRALWRVSLDWHE